MVGNCLAIKGMRQVDRSTFAELVGFELFLLGYGHFALLNSSNRAILM